LPIPEEDGSSVRFKLLREQDLGQPLRIIDEHPHLQTWEITSAKLIEFLKRWHDESSRRLESLQWSTRRSFPSYERTYGGKANRVCLVSK